jgi:sec-independent protein translocase protein TatA
MALAFIGGIGVPELLIVLAIVLVFFGGRRLPQLGRDLGGGMRGFKESLTSGDGDKDDEKPDDPTIGTDADPVEPIVEGEVVRDRP